MDEEFFVRNIICPDCLEWVEAESLHNHNCRGKSYDWREDSMRSWLLGLRIQRVRTGLELPANEEERGWLGDGRQSDTAGEKPAGHHSRA